MSDFYNDRFHIAGHGDYLQIEARQVENPNSDSFEFRKGIQGAFQKKKTFYADRRWIPILRYLAAR
jgi:hypothetical protein